MRIILFLKLFNTKSIILLKFQNLLRIKQQIVTKYQIKITQVHKKKKKPDDNFNNTYIERYKYLNNGTCSIDMENIIYIS